MQMPIEVLRGMFMLSVWHSPSHYPTSSMNLVMRFIEMALHESCLYYLLSWHLIAACNGNWNGFCWIFFLAFMLFEGGFRMFIQNVMTPCPLFSFFKAEQRLDYVRLQPFFFFLKKVLCTAHFFENHHTVCCLALFKINGLNTSCTLFREKNSHWKIFLELLIGHKYFHVECKSHAVKKQPFFCIEVGCSELYAANKCIIQFRTDVMSDRQQQHQQQAHYLSFFAPNVAWQKGTPILRTTI